MSPELEYATGAVITKPGSSEVTKTGDWRTFKPVVDKKKCIKCGICAQLCPEGAITLTDEGIEIDYDYCKGCLICMNECPKGAIEEVKEEK